MDPGVPIVVDNGTGVRTSVKYFQVEKTKAVNVVVCQSWLCRFEFPRAWSVQLVSYDNYE